MMNRCHGFPNRAPSQGIVLLSGREQDKMRRAGSLAAQLLDYLEDLVQPGISTKDLDEKAKQWLKAHGAISATLDYAPPGHPPFKGSICTSVNQVVCHGIPSPKHTLQEGDIINIDVTPILEGYHGDTSRTLCVGQVSERARLLVEVTFKAMMQGIATVKPGAHVGDIGAAIQEYVEANGFSVVRDLVGHGIGRFFHMEPQIPHFGKRGQGIKLRPGMAFTIEPMVNERSSKILTLRDGWTVVTQDGGLSAQFEHTVLVTENGVEILTR
ncbi:MAG: type I methionyl aminopeptidase [Cyanobacteriota bacterium]